MSDFAERPKMRITIYDSSGHRMGVVRSASVPRSGDILVCDRYGINSTVRFVTWVVDPELRTMCDVEVVLEDIYSQSDGSGGVEL